MYKRVPGGIYRAVEERACRKHTPTGGEKLSNNGAVSFKDWIISVFGEGIAKLFYGSL